MLADRRMMLNCCKAVACSAGLPRVLLSVLGLLAVFLPDAYAAGGQNSSFNGLSNAAGHR